MTHHGAMIVGMGTRSCEDAAVAKARTAERIKDAKARALKERMRMKRLRAPAALSDDARRKVAEFELWSRGASPLDTDDATQ